MPIIRTRRVQQGEVSALRFKFDMMGHRFRVWVYHVDGLQVETGPRWVRKEVRRFTKVFPFQAIALTHFHEDHSGNAAYLSQGGRIPVCMGEQTAEILAGPPSIPLYRQMLMGPLESVQGEVREWIETERFRFRAVHTPGHSDDHVVWVEEEQGWAFTGDLFISSRLTFGMRGESLLELAASIRRLLQYPIRTLFCSHAGIIPEGRKALEKKLDYLDWLREETLRLHQIGAPSMEIASRLLKKRPGLVWVSRGEMAPVHLIRSILREEQEKKA